jgi:flagellar motor switch protein FliN/FliY
MAELTSQRPPDTQQALAGAFCAGLTAAIEAMTGERPGISVREAVPDDEKRPTKAEADYWWRQPLSLAEDAVVWVCAPGESWTDLGTRALEAVGLEEAEAADIRQTYGELLQQGLSALAQAIGAELGREVTPEDGQETEDLPERHVVPLEVRYGDAGAHRLWVAFSDVLVAGLQPKDVPAQARPGSQRQDSRPKELAEASAPASEALALLLDVELPVSVSFGRAHLPIKDVLKLASGSIVELNRTVSEPVEVIVNNCVIARAEVVVVEANYGVRITEIISRRERLRTLN